MAVTGLEMLALAIGLAIVLVGLVWYSWHVARRDRRYDPHKDPNRSR